MGKPTLLFVYFFCICLANQTFGSELIQQLSLIEERDQTVVLRFDSKIQLGETARASTVVVLTVAEFKQHEAFFRSQLYSEAYLSFDLFDRILDPKKINALRGLSFISTDYPCLFYRLKPFHDKNFELGNSANPDDSEDLSVFMSSWEIDDKFNLAFTFQTSDLQERSGRLQIESAVTTKNRIDLIVFNPDVQQRLQLLLTRWKGHYHLDGETLERLGQSKLQVYINGSLVGQITQNQAKKSFEMNVQPVSVTSNNHDGKYQQNSGPFFCPGKFKN